MKTISHAACMALALAAAAPIAPAAAQGRSAQPEPDFPQVRASPGLYQSGNECAPDRAEAAWGAGGRFLGYICVRNPSRR